MNAEFETPPNTVPFEEVEKHFKERQQPTIKNFFLDIYYGVRRFFTYELWYYYKWVTLWGWQRWRYGVSDTDVWSFDHYLAKVSVRGLQHLKKHKKGVPCEFAELPEADAIKAWSDVLDKLIYTFNVAHEVLEMDAILSTTQEEYDKHIEFEKKIKEKYGYPSKILTPEETKRFHEGFDLFHQYFFDLWD